MRMATTSEAVRTRPPFCAASAPDGARSKKLIHIVKRAHALRLLLSITEQSPPDEPATENASRFVTSASFPTNPSHEERLAACESCCHLRRLRRNSKDAPNPGPRVLTGGECTPSQRDSSFLFPQPRASPLERSPSPMSRWPRTPPPNRTPWPRTT